MTLTKDDIDLAEQEFVLCWRDSEALLGDAIMHPAALGYEYRWKEICEAARRGINQDQFPDAGKMVDLSGKIAPEGGSWELLNEWERASAADPSMSVRCQSAGDDMVRCIRELEAKLAEEGSGADADAEEDARRHPWAPDKPAPQPEGGSGELLKIAEQFRAMNPPWFKAISDAAIRIKELEAHNDDLIKKYETEIKELEADRDSWKNLAWIERDETALRIRELEAKLAEADRTLQGFNYVSPHEAMLREKLEAAEVQVHAWREQAQAWEERCAALATDKGGKP